MLDLYDDKDDGDDDDDQHKFEGELLSYLKRKGFANSWLGCTKIEIWRFLGGFRNFFGDFFSGFRGIFFGI